MEFKKENKREISWITPTAKLASPIWKHFKISNDNTQTLCNICEATISHAGKNTTNMRRHMTRHHPTVEIDKKSLKLTAQSSESEFNRAQNAEEKKSAFFGIKKGSANERRITDAIMFYILQDLQ